MPRRHDNPSHPDRGQAVPHHTVGLRFRLLRRAGMQERSTADALEVWLINSIRPPS